MSITLIQALYDSQNQLPTDSAFYQNAIEDVEFFGICPQVYYLLKQQGRLEHTPFFFQDRLKQKYNNAMYLNLFIKNQTEQIFRKFEENGIDAIPLKGVRFAEKYFGHIGARPTSDIDLLIRKSDLERAIACVKLSGFTIEEKPIPKHFHCNFSKEIPGSPIPLTVEMHWDLLKDTTAELNIDEFWTQAQSIQTYKHIKELSDYHTFYMICLHGWRHNLISLKYFIDIIQMIHVLNDELNFSVLLKDASNHKTLRRLLRTLSIVYGNFPGLDRKKEFPQKRYVPFWEYAVYRHIHKRSFKLYADYMYYQLFSYDTVKHSLIELWDWLFQITMQMKNDGVWRRRT